MIAVKLRVYVSTIIGGQKKEEEKVERIRNGKLAQKMLFNLNEK